MTLPKKQNKPAGAERKKRKKKRSKNPDEVLLRKRIWVFRSWELNRNKVALVTT